MRFPFVWRKTAEDETAIWKAEADPQRVRADKAVRDLRTSEFNRRQIAALYDEQEQVTRRNSAARQDGFDEERARRAADRIARLARGVARARAEAATETRRADQLQMRLDDAVGLNTAAVALGESWQQRRQPRMPFDKPTAEEATAS